MFNYSLYRTQKLPISVEEAWAFFSVPGNLNEITPDDMSFKTISDKKMEKAYAGQITTYHVSPFLGIPMFWMTEITHVREGGYFVDEQRFGPYAFWHHQHFFTPIEGGVLMEDWIHYKLPMGILGAIAHKLFVRKKLEHIFNHRYAILAKRFGELKG